MSQRKAKEYRRAMEQYQGVAADVDDLKRRIGAMEVRHRREDQMAEAARRRARAAAREQQEQERVRAQEQAEAERREASRRRNERRRRIVRRRRITALACMAALVLAVVWAVATACAAVGADEPETILPDPVAVTPITTPAGNIICGAYLLGTHMANYGEPEKALMAYNMGAGGASQAWDAGITSTEYSAKVMEAANRWEAVVG